MMKPPPPLLLAAVIAVAAAPLSYGFAPTCSSISKPPILLSTTELHSVPNSLDTFTSGLASIARIKYGVSVDPEGISMNGPGAKYLPKVKKLYDIENDRDCRRVREVSLQELNGPEFPMS